jgi:ABC-type nitrate/sulfonate/bicarbonate transport system substrate-binding protein
MWGTSETWAKENAGKLEDFRAALAKAIDYIGSNEKESRATLKDYTGLPDEVVEKAVLPNYVSELRPQDLEVWLEAMKAVGGFQGEVDVDDLVPAKS